MATTSTPLPSTDLRKRKSFMIDDGNLSATSSKRPLTISSVQEAEDEDEERSRRRSMASIAEKLNETEHYSKEMILSHLETCMQLYADNKISTKNIWGFKIIDYISAMVRDDTFERDTLKYATSSMEVGAKVYGLRVDCVHNQTLQLASNMLRNFNTENDGDDEGGDENAPEDEANGNKQPGKQRRAKKHKIMAGDEPSILKDYKTILAPMKQLASVDFQIGPTGTNASGNSFLTSTVPMNWDTQFMFMSEEKYFQTMDPTEINEEDPNEETYPIDLEDFNYEELDLCVPFQNFQIANWDPDNENVVSQSHGGDPIFDSDGLPIPELDGSIHDPFMFPHDNDSSEEEENVAPQLGQPNIEFVTDVFVPDESNNEYFYNSIIPNSSHIVVNLWAGPSHWKLKYIKRRSTTFTGSVQQKDEQKRKKRTKKQEAIELIFNPLEEFTTTTQHPPRSKKLKKSKFRVPPQYIQESWKPMESFRSRYIIPISAATSPEKPSGLVDNFPADEYNYDNPNDSQFCIDANDDNDYDEDAHDAPGAADSAIGMFADNGIDMPEIVPKSTISYAKTAKKMNMKKLKYAVWDSLAGTDCYNKGEETEDHEVKVIGEKHFNDLYNNLPNKVNRSMQEAMSAPLAFAALLHLANEKSLMLKGTEEMDDIIIIQETFV